MRDDISVLGSCRFVVWPSGGMAGFLGVDCLEQELSGLRNVAEPASAQPLLTTTDRRESGRVGRRPASVVRNEVEKGEVKGRAWQG